MDYYDIIQSMSIAPFFDVILRVPPLFVIDELLRIGMVLPTKARLPNETYPGDDHVSSSLAINSFASHSFLDCDGDQSYLMIAFNYLSSIFVCLFSLAMFTLQTKHLVTVYFYLISLGMVFVSYWANVATMKSVVTFAEQSNMTTILETLMTFKFDQLTNFEPGMAVVQNLVLQTTLAIYFCYKLFGGYSGFVTQKLVIGSFLFPSSLVLYHKMGGFLHHAPVFATLLQLVICKFIVGSNSSSILKTLNRGYRYIKTFYNNFGLTALLRTEWSRLNVPWVLRIFWLLRMSEQLIRMLNIHYGDEELSYFAMLRTLLVNGCETLPAILGMTSIVSFICHYIGCFFQWVLLTDDEDEKSFGTISAVLFYILALQTGLSGLDQEKRFIRLCKNFCLLFTAVLHFVHNLVNPLLMSLSASYNPAVHKHLRALAVCGFLITFASSLLWFLWSNYSFSTWLLAVSVFSIEVIVKVLVSLAIYSLFLYVAYVNSFWEQLDDYVYMIRAFGNTIEFMFGIVLFFNGSWILMFESGSTVRAVMVCVHAYFNLWCEARAGWNFFMKRRSAVKKINSLPEAKAEQLQRHNDVCAICYQEMCHARITTCNHFFHAVCLRKWLYIQDRCPICHSILYKVNTEKYVLPEVIDVVQRMFHPLEGE